jgi:dTDP-4-dehydrorhamnose 3,5-epimerase
MQDTSTCNKYRFGILSTGEIAGVCTKALLVHEDARGYLYEILRRDDPFFAGFGQYYSNLTRPGVVKGFHKHKQQTDYMCCVSGSVEIVLIDSSNQLVQHFYLSEESKKLLVVPPGVWHGWRCLGTRDCIIINASSEPYDRDTPDEERCDPHDNPWGYKWCTVDK